MTKKSTRKALLMSALSLLLCCAMLVGSTFAWFSDTATSGKNTITAGNLDIELMYLDKEFSKDILEGETLGSSAAWAKTDKDTNLFEHKVADVEEKFLWEPGAMFISKPFKLTNEGNLALEYQLTAKIEKETTLEGRSLSDVIQMKVADKDDLKEAIESAHVDAGTYTQENRKAIWENLKGGATPVGSHSSGSFILPKDSKDVSSGYPKGETDPMFVVLYWEPSNDETDNKYNLNNEKKATGDTTDALTVEFSLNVYATQAPSEKDSFGDKYDENAMAQEKVLEAVKSGIDMVNKELALNGNLKDYKLSELTATANGYKSELTLPKEFNLGRDYTKVLSAIQETLAPTVENVVKAEADNIEKIILKGNESEEGKTIENATLRSGDWLVSGLTDAIKIAGLGTGEMSVVLTVIVVDTSGTAVTYEIYANISAAGA